MAASYASVDDADGNAPGNLLSECKRSLGSPTSPLTTVTIQNIGVVTSDQLLTICGSNDLCIIPEGVTLQVTSSINVGALVVRGKVEWNDSTQDEENAFLCAGYVAMEGNGSWDMNIQNKLSWIYIKDNGAVHSKLRSRSFGGMGNSTVNIRGRELVRTWSLLSETIVPGGDTMKLLHNPHYMNWHVGDRIAISSTEKSSNGFSQSFKIKDISEDGTILVDHVSERTFEANFIPTENGMEPLIMSAEVVNLDRNIVITGDDFTHERCGKFLGTFYIIFSFFLGFLCLK